MHRSVIVGIAVALGIALAPAVQAATSCPAGCPRPPRNSRFESTPALVPIAGAAAVILTAALAGPKKKNVLAVEATVRTGVIAPGAPLTIAVYAEVTNVPAGGATTVLMEPTTGLPGLFTIVDCGAPGGGSAPVFSCTNTSTWWLDWDQNAAFFTAPPTPITVNLYAFDIIGGAIGAPIEATLTVRESKK